MSYYIAIKMIHLSCVGLTLLLFIFRGTLMIMSSSLLQSKPLKIAPHIVDTVLLTSAILLTVELHQYPFAQSWLTAKVLALIVYIVLGTLALKRAPTKATRIVCFAAALATFGYILMVARTHSPMPF